MTTHLLSITSDDVALVIADGTPDSERADAIVAADAFTDGDHGDELLRPGLYPFHVDDDGNGLIGSRIPWDEA
jgi:hypothetical protein